MKASPAIHFEPVAEAHLPMLRRWLEEPHVRQWWGDPDTEVELIRTGQESGEVDAYIVHVDGEPAAYIQSWHPSEHDEEPWQKDMPRDTVGVDILIGRPEMTGRGFGPQIIRAFARMLFEAGVPRLIIDPDGDNDRAVKAYGAAGFTKFAEHRGEQGVTVLMEITPRTFSRTL